MTSDQINDLVNKLEPLFIGYTAKENRLVNSNGMVLVFRICWNNRTTVSGLHASRTHSIGCSFEKPLDKIFKDIRRRLMTDYHVDFLKLNDKKLNKLKPRNSTLRNSEPFLQSLMEKLSVTTDKGLIASLLKMFVFISLTMVSTNLK